MVVDTATKGLYRFYTIAKITKFADKGGLVSSDDNVNLHYILAGTHVALAAVSGASAISLQIISTVRKKGRKKETEKKIVIRQSDLNI